MRNGGAERAGRGALPVYVNPLVVTGDGGELVDAVLVDLQPIREADFGPDHGA
jgi:hypothetical protein